MHGEETNLVFIKSKQKTFELGNIVRDIIQGWFFCLCMAKKLTLFFIKSKQKTFEFDYNNTRLVFLLEYCSNQPCFFVYI